MSEDPTSHPLAIFLSATVPLAIAELEKRGGPGPSEFADAREVAQEVAEKGDLLLYAVGAKYRSKVRGEPARLFGRLVRALAIMSFCPGGVRFAGHHWQGHMHEDNQETGEMPHFADGTEVKVGMRVRGCGYNPDSKGYDRTHGIEGIVVGVRPGDDKPGACTLDIAFLRPRTVHETRGVVYLADELALVCDTEHGDTVGFEPVGKPAGG